MDDVVGVELTIYLLGNGCGEKLKGFCTLASAKRAIEEWKGVINNPFGKTPKFLHLTLEKSIGDIYPSEIVVLVERVAAIMIEPEDEDAYEEEFEDDD